MRIVGNQSPSLLKILPLCMTYSFDYLSYIFVMIKNFCLLSWRFRYLLHVLSFPSGESLIIFEWKVKDVLLPIFDFRSYLRKNNGVIFLLEHSLVIYISIDEDMKSRDSFLQLYKNMCISPGGRTSTDLIVSKKSMTPIFTQVMTINKTSNVKHWQITHVVLTKLDRIMIFKRF